MPVLFNYDEVEPVTIGNGVKKQALITPERVKNDCILLDRFILDEMAIMELAVSNTDLAWFQLLE